MPFTFHLHIICMRSYFIHMYFYVIRMSLVCTFMSFEFHSYLLVCHPYATLYTPMSSVCHSYVLVCHPYVTSIYSHVIRMSLVCTRMSSVCHAYVLVCHTYVTRMHSHVIRMSLICTRMSYVCHSYVLVCHLYFTCMWFYHEPVWWIVDDNDK